MTAVDVSAIGSRTSNAQPVSARLRRGRRRTSNQRARSALINSALLLRFRPRAPARLNEVRIRNSLTMAILTSGSGCRATESRTENAARGVCEVVRTPNSERFDSCAPAHFDLSVCPSMSLASPRAPFVQWRIELLKWKFKSSRSRGRNRQRARRTRSPALSRA